MRSKRLFVFLVVKRARSTMSSIGPTRAADSTFPVPPEPQDGCAPSSGSLVQLTAGKDELQPQELLLLREFFLLLDQWDRERSQ